MKPEFDLTKFEEENPVIEVEDNDPFVDKINGRESLEPLVCFYCGGVYDRVSKERIGDADPNGEEVSSLRELCSGCLTVAKILPSYFEY